MGTHFIPPCSEVTERAGTGVGASALRILREILDAIVMITDPEGVRETLQLWESKSGA
jgi:hypothetical protein